MWKQETVSHCEGTAFQKKQLRRLQAKSREMDATVWIGKQGPTDELMKQVITQLKKRELVKAKVQKYALIGTEIAIVAEKVAALTGSTLVEVMGHTFTLHKRREVVKSVKSRDTRKTMKPYH